jgi:hypothetical protein
MTTTSRHDSTELAHVWQRAERELQDPGPLGTGLYPGPVLGRAWRLASADPDGTARNQLADLRLPRRSHMRESDARGTTENRT